MGDGFVGHLSTRTALRAISAYLRTLGVGKCFWAMPKPLATELSLLALPVHPTLAFLRPRLPSWLPTTRCDFSGDSKAIEASLRSLLEYVQQARPDDELIAFSSPTLISKELIIEVSAVRWFQADDSSIDDTDLAEHLNRFWSGVKVISSSTTEPLSTTTTFRPDSPNELMDKESASWPLATFLDFSRMGYLQHDLYPSRLFVPTMNGTMSVDIIPLGGHLNIKAGEDSIAELCYWNAGWGAAHPYQLSGNCGTALISQGTVYREVSRSVLKPLRSFYLWQVRTLRRQNSYNGFSEELVVGAMFE